MMKYSILGLALLILVGCNHSDSQTLDETPKSAEVSAEVVELESTAGTYVVAYSQPSWCPACKRMVPIIAAAQAEGARIYVISDAAEAERRVIHSFPTFVVYRDGKQVETHTGTRTKEQLMAWASGAIVHGDE